MTINQTIGQYEFITDESNGDQLVIRHVETGAEFTIDGSGSGMDLSGIQSQGVVRLTLGDESPIESFGSGLTVNGTDLEASGGGGGGAGFRW